MARAKKGRSNLVFMIAFLSFAVYVVISFTVMQIDIAKRRDELSLLQQELKEQEYIKNEITDILNSGENTEYITKIAREKLGFVMPGEKVFYDVTPGA